MTTNIKEYSQTEAALAELRKQYADKTYDVTTTRGMKLAKADRKAVRDYRTALERTRKEIKGPALEHCRKIDSEAKRITAELLKIEEPIAEQIKAEEERQAEMLREQEEAEAKRIADIEARLANIRSTPDLVSIDMPPDVIQARIDTLRAISASDSFDEYRREADDAIADAIQKLTEKHQQSVKYAQEQAELEELRRKQAEHEEAERKRQAEEEQKRRDEEAEARAKLQAEQAELAEKRKQQEAEDKKRREEQEAIERKQREEEDRIRKEREALERAKREEDERVRKAEQEQREAEKRAQEAASKAQYPGDKAIVGAISVFFDVPKDVVVKWLMKYKHVD